MFMLIAGVSASEEMCLVGSGTAMFLDACASAVAAGDGRELWSLQTGGQLLHVVTKLCAGASKAVVGESIGLVACSEAGHWNLLPNGQVQLGEKCLSQVGAGAGLENLAAHASVYASSSVHPASHGAAAAVDFDDASFWASKADEANPVEFIIDLGEERNIDVLKITWEYPPQAFSVSSSVDGERWVQAFATDMNMESVTRTPLRQAPARKVKVAMQKPHVLYGTSSGQSYYAIKSITMTAPRLRAVLDDCATAARSKDARDKYFPSYVSEFDPSLLAALQAELPPLAAAKASLSLALGEIAGTQSKLPECRSAQALSEHVHDAVRGGKLLDTHSDVLSSLESPSSGLEELVDNAQGINAAGVKAFLASAKAVIIKMRAALV